MWPRLYMYPASVASKLSNLPALSRAYRQGETDRMNVRNHLIKGVLTTSQSPSDDCPTPQTRSTVSDFLPQQRSILLEAIFVDPVWRTWIDQPVYFPPSWHAALLAASLCAIFPLHGDICYGVSRMYIPNKSIHPSPFHN
jgi:hypothetical protein